jgi:hypothetical protein
MRVFAKLSPQVMHKRFFSNKTFQDLLCGQVSGDSNEMREFASRICRDYLYGPWKSVTPQNIGFKHIR